VSRAIYFTGGKATRGRFERRMADSAQEAGFTPIPPPKAKPAKPVESYGIQLVPCPAGNARLRLNVCTSRWERANRPINREDAIRSDGVASDLQASQCRGCSVGAGRCGKAVPAKRPREAGGPVCKKCRQHFEPVRRSQTWCEVCRERKKAGRRVLAHHGPRGLPTV